MVEHYTESIHGKGLLESGLTVTATCANCHTAHGELPASDPASTVNRENVAKTCAQCHRGIYELFDEQHPLPDRVEDDRRSCRPAATATPPTTSSGPTRATSS